MATISGSLDYVSTRPAAVSEVLVRAPESRTRGTGVITTGNDRFPVVDGVVTFTAFAGPAVLSLVSGGRLSESLPIFVGDAAEQTLKQVVDAAGLLDDATQSELEALAQQVMGDAESVAVAAGRAVTAAESAATSAESAATSASSAQASADAAAVSAESAAVSGRSASESAEQAKGDAESAATSAESAATSADAAALSAESAAVSGRSASESAEQAKGDAESAATSAESAATSADAAALAAQDASVRAVADKVNELLEGAPEAYDTLLEIAEELERSQSVEAALVKEIAGKAPSDHTHTTAEISDAGEVGKQVLSATSADEARAVIGAGTSSLVLGTTASTAAAGDHTHSTGQISGLDAALAGIPKIQVVDAVPETPDAETLYLVREV